MKTLLHLQNLQISFGQQLVLNHVSFELQSGEIIGLIGPSGAGKSTMIKTMLGMEKADSGIALVLDQTMPNRHILGDIGYMAQSDALYEALSGQENLEFFGQIKGIPKKDLTAEITHVAQVVDLTDHLNKAVSLAIALLGNPQLLILDEPTVGIDPSLRKKIWRELKAHRDKGVGILVTTHVMDEAELTDKVGLLLGGKIIAFDTPSKLKASYGVSSIEEVFLKAEGE